MLTPQPPCLPPHQVEVLLPELWDPLSGPVYAEEGDQLRFWKLTRRFLENLAELQPGKKIRAVRGGRVALFCFCRGLAGARAASTCGLACVTPSRVQLEHVCSMLDLHSVWLPAGVPRCGCGSHAEEPVDGRHVWLCVPQRQVRARAGLRCAPVGVPQRAAHHSVVRTRGMASGAAARCGIMLPHGAPCQPPTLRHQGVTALMPCTHYATQAAGGG